MEPYIALSYIDTYHPEMLAALTNGLVDFEMLRHDAAEVQSREGLRTSKLEKTTSTSKTRISNVVTWRVDMLFDMIIHDIRFCHIWCDFWCYMYSIVFACIRILQWDIWSLEFQNQVLSLLRNLPSWQFPRCGPVWKGVNHFVVSKVFTNECALMSNLLWWSITLLVQHIQWNQKKYRKTFPLMKKYGGDKVQGVTDIEKLCSSLLPTAPSQRAAKLRSRHQCRCMIWSSNHVMATNFQTGWTWMNPS